MKKVAIAATALALGITSSHGVTLIPAGSGNFTAPGEIDTFALYTGLPVDLISVTITLTSAASQTGTIITNVDAVPATFDGTITSNYSAQLLGFLAGGTVNLSDAQNSGTLNPNEAFEFSVSDSGFNTLVINSPALLAFFISGSPATGNIEATTLSSGFNVSVTPLGTSFLTEGGTSSTSYTWDVVYTVPEPSAALLGGLGMLGLLRRRR